MLLLAVAIILFSSLGAMLHHFLGDLSLVAVEYDGKWFRRWSLRGALTPIIAWAVMNLGTMPFMPPLTLTVALARNKGHWFEAFNLQTALAVLVIGSCWASVTCGWFLVVLFRHARNREDLIISTLFWTPLTLPVIWLFTHFAGWSTTGFAVLLWLGPLTIHLLREAQTNKPAPTYSQAIARMKFGNYGAAELAIISQLEKCESDYEGWIMLADLYARHFNDLAQAQQTILDLCNDPNTTMPQIAVALHRLADWQLELRGDPGAARKVLTELCQRMPGTHLAFMAQQRINQLPASPAEFAEMQKHRTFQMPKPDLIPDASSDISAPALGKDEAVTAANELVERLHTNPKDIESREKLARIFEGLGKLDLALEQLELLAGMPGATPEKAIEWLNLMAAWEIKHHGETEAAQNILRRLIHEFPQSSQAFAAQKRLNFMKRGARDRQGGESLRKSPSPRGEGGRRPGEGDSDER